MIKGLNNLAKWWHGDLHPTAYSVVHEGSEMGVGILYSKALAAGNVEQLTGFNILLARQPLMLASREHMIQAVMDFSIVNTFASKPYLGGTVGEYACLVSPEQLRKFLATATKVSK